MANTTSQKRPEAPVHRGPAKRAQGLDPEITAQPRPVADDMALEEPGLADGLSVEPEDLGSRFLSEAVEQGSYINELAPPSDASLFEPPAGDEPLVSPNFEPDRSIWEQTVDLSLQTGNDARALRSPGVVAGDDFEDVGRSAVEDMKTAPMDLNDSSIRELSLFDREGAESDDTVSPDLDTDEAGPPPREEPRARAERSEAARGIDVDAAKTPTPSTNLQAGGNWLQGAARSMLIGTANLLRSLADRLTPSGTRGPAKTRKSPPSRADEPSIPHLPIG